MAVATIKWVKNGVRLIDQRRLPSKLEYLQCRDVRTMWQAIRTLSVRGAPAIGVAAAYGVILGTKDFKGTDKKKFVEKFNKVCGYLATSRPTAVNLFNALDRMKAVVRENGSEDIPALKRKLKKEADDIYQEDRVMNRKMGDFGAKLIKARSNIMTVCNAGALATADYGTALGVMYSAKKKGKKFKVFACETRPLLQGARLTAWELLREKIDTTLICDNMAATLMKQGKVDAVFTGADRVASNGDSANKIGTYNLAILADYHNIPFYIVAPFSTFDMKISSGKQIPIEERSSNEVTNFAGQATAPKRVKVYNPAFDVANHELITAIVTEYGVIYPPFKSNIKKIYDKYAKRKK